MNLTIRFLKEEELDESKLEALKELINRVYAIAESGMWHPNTTRVETAFLKSILVNKELLVAELEGRIVGCVNIHLYDEQIASFGMLVADPDYRGLGIGRELVKAAEKWAIENGRSIMRLELLVPKDWKHPSKEFLKKWYTRIGYVIQHTEPLEEMYPNLIDKLATPCDFCVYHKKIM